MPGRSRRVFIELLGIGTATVVAGCQTDPAAETPIEGSASSSSPTGTPTGGGASTTAASESPTATDAETESETASPSEAPADVDCAVVPRPAAAWPVPRRSPARDGYVVDTDGFEAAPTVAWEVEPSRHGDDHAAPSYGLPVAADGSLYLTNELGKGPQRPTYGHVHALDAERGDRLWASGRLRSPSHPVVWGDLVVVVAENEDLGAMVVAYDRIDGTRRWTREFPHRDRGFVPAGDHLYLAVGEVASPGSVYALATDGSTVWSRAGGFRSHVNEGPVVGSDAVYVGTHEGRLHALARDDGTISWTHRFRDPSEQRPFVSGLIATDCRVVAVVEGRLTALDAGGTLVWEDPGEHGSVVTDGELVYVSSVPADGEPELRARSTASGDARWTVQVDASAVGPLIVAGDAVYARFDESIVSLDREDGTERWRTEDALEDPALAHGTLYGTTRNRLIALR